MIDLSAAESPQLAPADSGRCRLRRRIAVAALPAAAVAWLLLAVARDAAVKRIWPGMAPAADPGGGVAAWAAALLALALVALVLPGRRPWQRLAVLALLAALAEGQGAAVMATQYGKGGLAPARVAMAALGLPTAVVALHAGSTSHGLVPAGSYVVGGTRPGALWLARVRTAADDARNDALRSACSFCAADVDTYVVTSRELAALRAG
jgi:hypothetical protein